MPIAAKTARDVCARVECSMVMNLLLRGCFPFNRDGSSPLPLSAHSFTAYRPYFGRKVRSYARNGERTIDSPARGRRLIGFSIHCVLSQSACHAGALFI